jgi:hypothetical protein
VATKALFPVGNGAFCFSARSEKNGFRKAIKGRNETQWFYLTVWRSILTP